MINALIIRSFLKEQTWWIDSEPRETPPPGCSPTSSTSPDDFQRDPLLHLPPPGNGKFEITGTKGSYSCPSLVVPFFEELISRTFLDENRFRLVSQDRMSVENGIGYLFFSPPTTFVLPQTVTMLLLLHWRVKWIYAWAGLTDLWDKQIHESCFCTNLFEILTEQWDHCDCLGQN